MSYVKKKPNLTHDIIDVTEYGKDGIKIIDSNPTNIENSKHYTKYNEFRNNSEQEIINTNAYQGNVMKSPPTDNCKHILDSIVTNLNKLESIIEPASNFPINFNESDSPPPRLIRSNSYILENPSPILLAHLDKFSLDHNEDQSTKQFIDGNQNVPSMENDYILFDDNEVNNSNSVYDNADNTSPKIEVIQTDISVQHITVDCNKNTCEEIEMQKSSLELVDPNCQLIQILKSIPEDYSKRILDLIEKQQIEQYNKTNLEDIESPHHLIENHMNSYMNISSNNDDQEEMTWCNDISESNHLIEKQDDIISISPSQSVYYTLSSTCTVLPTSPSIHIVDLENEDPQSEILAKVPKDDHLGNLPEKFQHNDFDNCRRKLSFRQEKLKQLDFEITSIKQVSFLPKST